GSCDAGGLMGVSSRTNDRLEEDLKLYQRLIDSEFVGHDSEQVASQLVGYAWPVLRGWISRGDIYRECGRVRRPGFPTEAERDYLKRYPEEIEDLVKDTIAEAWDLFRRCGVRGLNRWDPDRGTALTTYFVGTCKLAFPKVFRGWQRKMQGRLAESCGRE